MSQPMENASGLRAIMRYYNVQRRAFCRQSGLSQTEFDIILFLHNNPRRDTARDIVERRMLPKSNVSQAVESLIQKQLLCRSQDKADRRRIHLSLTEQGQALLPGITGMMQEFERQAFQGFSETERQQFVALFQRMVDNLKQTGESEDDEQRQ